MFCRLIQSFSLTTNRSQICFNRFLSQTIRPLRYTNNTGKMKPISLGNDLTSSMKLSVIKRIPRKKCLSKQTNNSSTIINNSVSYNVCAYATADWYDLDRLKQHLFSLTNPFQLVPISDLFNNVLCIQLTDKQISSSSLSSPSQVFIFDDGAVIFWNVEDKYREFVFNQIRDFSDNFYPKNLIESEKEIMNFVEVSSTSTLTKDLIKINCQSETDILLDKYTFSNALALSVKLGIWEALLDDEVEFVADLANRLKQGKHIKIEHGLMQRKSGELYSLKHAVNLSHDFLDTPDFYWSNSRLESLYKKVFNYFSIAKRTRVLNERLNFSLELISVIEASLNEKKHVRLEWIIIILICAEVFFNIIDHLDFVFPKTPRTSD